MTATHKGDGAASRGDSPIRLRVEVYDALAATRGATSVTAQAALHGIGRQHMSAIRSGDLGQRGVSLGLAMRIASDLGTSVEALFEKAA